MQHDDPSTAEETRVAPYSLDEKAKLDLQNRFTYHAPHGDQAERYQEIRLRCLELAEFITSMTPRCREQSRALTAIDDAMFNANAAIARHEPAPEEA